MDEPVCPDDIDLVFARELLEAWGEDPSRVEHHDCWRSLDKKFPHLKGRAERYFESTTVGNGAFGAAQLVIQCKSPREWGEGVADEALTGDPAFAAEMLVVQAGSNVRWGERRIERARIGNPAWAAYCMFCFQRSNSKWCCKVIEGCMDFVDHNHLRYVIEHMLKYRKAPASWCKPLLERLPPFDWQKPRMRRIRPIS